MWIPWIDSNRSGGVSFELLAVGNRVDRSLLPSIRRMGVGFLQRLSLSCTHTTYDCEISSTRVVWGFRMRCQGHAPRGPARSQGWSSRISFLRTCSRDQFNWSEAARLGNNPILLSSSHCRWGDSTTYIILWLLLLARPQWMNRSSSAVSIRWLTRHLARSFDDKRRSCTPHVSFWGVSFAPCTIVTGAWHCCKRLNSAPCCLRLHDS